MKFEILELGLVPYSDALQIMDDHHSRIVKNNSNVGVLLVLEHPPTVTLGNRNLEQDVLFSKEALSQRGVSFFKTDRGGSATIHEPGQVVVYPIFNLYQSDHTVRSYVCALESAMIKTCEQFGIKSARDPINPGIWVGQNKIGALGIRVLERVTKHGIALNVCNSLETFKNIIPCGLKTRGVTSILNELNNMNENFNTQLTPTVKDVSKILTDYLNQLISNPSK